MSIERKLSTCSSKETQPNWLDDSSKRRGEINEGKVWEILVKGWWEALVDYRYWLNLYLLCFQDFSS